MFGLLCGAQASTGTFAITGLTEEQLAKVKDCSVKRSRFFGSANMSLGINTLMKLIQDAAKVLATAGFDMEIVEKHHKLKCDAPSGTAIALGRQPERGLWMALIIMLIRQKPAP